MAISNKYVSQMI